MLKQIVFVLISLVCIETLYLDNLTRVCVWNIAAYTCVPAGFDRATAKSLLVAHFAPPKS